jgi:hypothetical protein
MPEERDILNSALNSTEPWRAPTKWSIKLQSAHSVDDLILNYDPESPPESFRQAACRRHRRARPAVFPGGLSRGHRATHLTPDYLPSRWYEYRRNVAD